MREASITATAVAVIDYIHLQSVILEGLDLSFLYCCKSDDKGTNLFWIEQEKSPFEVIFSLNR